MLSQKHIQKQEPARLYKENKELWQCYHANAATINDLNVKVGILAKENQRFVKLFTGFHKVVMSNDDKLIAEFINIYHQNHLEK